MNLRFALDGTPIKVVEVIPPAVATGLSGLDDPHGADVDAFADAAYAGIVRSDPEVGFQMTESEQFRQQLAAENLMFAGFAGRFPVKTYGDRP
jgi:uncharacterized oxidoreductase